jgi:enoyl-CoA hydratase/carnithine racemase
LPPIVQPSHLRWSVADRVGTIILDRPERKNALTFEVYADLRDTFRALKRDRDVRVVLLAGNGGNFCSGGDVHEIIGPLTERTPEELLEFTTMTSDVVRAMREAPQLIISAIEGVCVGAGACLALASDFRVGTENSRIAFLFARVGLSGGDMGACALLPRIVGAGRATDLLITGREIGGEEAFRIGFLTRLVGEGEAQTVAQGLARELAAGPTRAYATTKALLDEEATLGLNDALEAESKAQASCMESDDFREAYRAFVERRQPDFQGR